MNALIAGEIDLLMNVDPTLVDAVSDADGVEMFSAPSGSHVCYAMTNVMAPFDDVNVRRALKHSFDRQKFIDLAFGGYGVVGNDHCIPSYDPYYCSDLAAPEVDADKVKFYLNKAGMVNTNFELTLSDAVYGGVNAGTVMVELMRETGVNLTVKRTASDGYWSAYSRQGSILWNVLLRSSVG